MEAEGTGKRSPAEGDAGRPIRRAGVPRCPLCLDRGKAPLHGDLPDPSHGVPVATDLVRCSGCGSVYQDPAVVPEDLHRLYPEDYYTHAAQGTGAPRLGGGLRDRVRRSVQRAIRGEPAPVWARLAAGSRRIRERAFYGLFDPLLPREREPGRALEIGPGSGWDLGLLARAGWVVEAVEWDPVAARVASETSGQRVHVGDFLEVEAVDGPWDLIYAHHVLEHLPDPEAFAGFLRRNLAAAGRAVVVTPNPHGIGARTWGRAWAGWRPPRHLVLPSREGLWALARRTGLEVEVETLTRHSPAWWGEGADPAPGLVPWLRLRSWIEAALGRASGEELLAVFRRA